MSTFATTQAGLTICNFSSAHPFTLDDGTIIPACEAEWCRAMMLESHEDVSFNGKWYDICLRFEMSEQVQEALESLHDDELYDIIIVPFPVMECIKAESLDLHYHKCRVIRMKDRVNKIAYSDRFCI